MSTEYKTNYIYKISKYATAPHFDFSEPVYIEICKLNKTNATKYSAYTEVKVHQQLTINGYSCRVFL